MILRSASLLAAAALAGLAAPALAQYHSAPPPLPEEEWQDEQPDDWQADESYGDEDPDWRGDEHGRDRGGDRGAPGLPPLHHGPHAGPPSRMGYAPDQRSAWLEQCRRVYYRDDRGERRGEAIGAVLGGVAGAVAGNRIADGSRLAGTLIGGGVGALAGSAIGGVIGEASDQGRYDDRLDQCEDYLVRYEQSYAAAYAQPYAYGAQVYGYTGPVMWVRVPIMRERRRDCGCQEVVEEVIEEQPAPRARRSVPAPRRDKRVRYTK